MQDKEKSLDVYGPSMAGALGTGVMGNYLCWQVPSLAVHIYFHHAGIAKASVPSLTRNDQKVK